MERLGALGVHTLEELQTFSSRVSPAVRRKRHLAEHLPHSPGVYLFKDDQERVLYVGTSRDLRSRVRSYFTASESRSRMGEMVNLATNVTGIECATPLEARVRELRLIAAHKPRYNKRSRFPEKVTWLKLTVEPWPRLSLVRKISDDGADYLGPVHLGRTAEKCLAALHETFPVRQCTDRLPRLPSAQRLRARRDGARPVALRRQRLPRRLRRARRRGPRQHARERPDEVVEALTARMGRLAARSATRRPRSTATASPRSCAPRRGPSGSGRCPRAPSSSPPAARRTGGGRCTSSAAAAWPPPV